MQSLTLGRCLRKDYRLDKREAGRQQVRVSTVFCDSQKSAEIMRLEEHPDFAPLLYLCLLL